MLTKADFQQAIQDSIAAYPVISPLYQASDPRIIQHLDAMATMLAMFSAQIETSLSEPFEKARDSTILADAAMRGIISKATPARATLMLINDNELPFQVANQRIVLDSNGYEWRIETPVTIPALGTANVEAIQLTTAIINHVVTGTVPFYAIQIPTDSSGFFLANIALSDAYGEYEHRERYVNTLPNERVFHVETDDRKLMWVRLGYSNVVGVQPRDGDNLTLTVGYTAGDIRPTAGSPLSFDYLLTPYDNFIKISFNSLLISGNNPPDIGTLRDLCRYPSVYDHSAVYLGEFDFLIRRTFTTLRFLSVWNETIEEQVRGASVDNINTLFVSCLSHDSSELVLEEGAVAYILQEYQLTPLQKAIRQKISEADNSYRVRFITPVRSKIKAEIDAQVSTSYPSNTVKEQIIAALLEAFGESSSGSRRGRNQPLYKQVYDLLKLKIPAISSESRSDAKVYITDPSAVYHPENWAYMTANSLTVTIANINVVTNSWG
jgi:hypothetical protein